MVVHPFLLMLYHLTEEQLLSDLHIAYHDARRHKRNKPYQRRFEAMAEKNLQELAHELFTHTYKPRPSTCFIITDPKKREVFAADFRDRIVHHLYYNYVHEMFERTFIADSYSCIKGRGTHYGINRLDMHIRQESQNYSEPCYVMKMDIRGYFMSINRKKLLDICLSRLRKMQTHKVSKDGGKRWEEIVDMDFVFYLTREIVLLNPIEDCRIIGKKEEWEDLPYNKSLFHSDEDCGLPIGNLTSQLFSNVYMSVFDDFMKRVLHCRHYGRYVDDFYVVSADKDWLRNMLHRIESFLQNILDLALHHGKLMFCNVRQGVEFLGAYIKPWRRYISNHTLTRMRKKINALQYCEDADYVRRAVLSFHGVLCHYKTYNVNKKNHFFDLFD